MPRSPGTLPPPKVSEDKDIKQAAPRPKITRSLGEIQVYEASASGLVKCDHGKFDTSAKADQWIKENGSEGQTFHVVRLIAVRTPKIEVRQRVTFG